MDSLKYNWQKLNGELDEVVEFSQQHYPNFKEMPERLVRKLLETYKKTTFVYFINNAIKGFVIFQEWPNCLNFIVICLPFGTERENLKAILSGRHLLPRKKFVWFDETKMEGRGICHQ